jgi:hypothetical protein
MDDFAAGDTIDTLVPGGNYPATDGWTLKYRFVPRIAGNAISVTAAAEGSDYRVTITPTVTATFGAGDYGWSRWVEKTGARHVIESGQVTVTTDPTAITVGTDTRSQAQKAVDDCLAALADLAASAEVGGASTGARITKRYVIGNREMEFEGTTDQIAQQLGAQGGGLLAFWNGQLSIENAARNASLGLADRRRIYLQARRA